uniref:Pectin acetylesterase n=1 Tax=Oryza barthii TaxID=65489 RepID=A0A0D3FZT2_9ORYZ
MPRYCRHPALSSLPFIASSLPPSLFTAQHAATIYATPSLPAVVTGRASHSQPEAHLLSVIFSVFFSSTLAMAASSGEWLSRAAMVLVLGLVVASSAKAGDVDMVFLKSAVSTGAVCLDGSPPVYHFSPGSGSGANNWLVHMEGGGWCRNAQECSVRQGNFRGSSKFMRPLSFSGIIGGNQRNNPDFYNWNRIKVRYCDGSSFTGDVETVVTSTNLHFRGARVWNAIIEDLLAKGMSKAQNALLSGCSAGGLAAILHCDQFRDLLPATANVKCFSDAGFFVDGKDITGNDFVRTFYKDVVNLHGSAKNLPSSCTSKMSPDLCFFPQNVVPTLRTPLFILNAAYDAWQIKNVLAPSAADKKKTWAKCKLDITACSSSQLTTLQNFRTDFLAALPKPEQSPANLSIFIDSCYAHCQSGSQDTWLAQGSPVVEKTQIGKAVGDWFHDREVSRRIDCPYPCNPTCKNRDDD